MVESTIFWDGFGKGLPGDNWFDNITNILDFPIESMKEDNSDDIEDFQLLGPIPLDIFQGFSTPPSQATGKPGFRPNDHVRSDETSDKKQLLEVTEISSISIPTDSSHGKELSLSQTPSPVSVLERMSTGPELLVPVRTRSKRSRHLTFTKWPLITLVNPSEKKGKEMKKRKLSHFSNVTEVEENSSSQRCSHCQVTKTPLWREGPMGPETLCNACGVHYRSGCLFPEYRPAASPTFVPTLHSNSHKKVIQMRDTSIQKSFR